jgi:hypothetical protein
MEKVSAILAAILLPVLMQAGLHAQTTERAGISAPDTPLAVCGETGSDGRRNYPCDDYIGANVRNDADTIKYLLEEINQHKSSSLNTSDDLYLRDQIVQWTLVVLALMITIATAITKSYPDFKIRKIDFAIIPVILAAFSAAVTSLNVYYQFGEYTRLNESVGYELAELESDIHFAIFRHVAGREEGEASRIGEDTIASWHERLETILQRYLKRETGDGG